MAGFEVRPIGTVESSLTDRAEAPRQGYLGAPSAWLVFEPWVEPACTDIAVGDEVIVLTWLNLSDREVLRTYPGRDASLPVVGVFNTRSPDRPNPIGLHRVRVLARDGLRIQVSDLEAIDGTPVIDVKPVLRDER